MGSQAVNSDWRTWINWSLTPPHHVWYDIGVIVRTCEGVVGQIQRMDAVEDLDCAIQLDGEYWLLDDILGNYYAVYKDSRSLIVMDSRETAETAKAYFGCLASFEPIKKTGVELRRWLNWSQDCAGRFILHSMADIQEQIGASVTA